MEARRKHFGDSRGPTSLNRKNDPQSLLKRLRSSMLCYLVKSQQTTIYGRRLTVSTCNALVLRHLFANIGPVWDLKQPGQLRKDVLIRHKLVVLPGSFLKLDVRVGDAMLACAKAFGIKVREKMSRRTVLRARDNGGYFGLMQLGHEIISSLQVYFWYSSIHSLWLNKIEFH